MLIPNPNPNPYPDPNPDPNCDPNPDPYPNPNPNPNPKGGTYGTLTKISKFGGLRAKKMAKIEHHVE